MSSHTHGELKSDDLHIFALPGPTPETHIAVTARALSAPEKPASLESGSEDKSITVEQDVVSADDRTYVEFEENDSRNPHNFSPMRKWAITLMTSAFLALSVAGSSSYALGTPSMIRNLHASTFQATAGISTFTAGYSVVPLLISSVSEDFGRQPIYIVTVIGFTLMHLVVAKAENLSTVLVARFFGGVFGSGSILSAGTIADLWLPLERGLPMSIFSLAAVGGTGLGPVFAGYVEMNPRLEWRWIQWIHLMCGLSSPLYYAIAQKSFTQIVWCADGGHDSLNKGDALRCVIAKRLRKQTGDKRYRARVEDDRASLGMRIFISLTSPFYFMFTEPVVASFSLWIGFAWGITFVLIDQGSTGLVFVTFFLLWMCTNQIQERLYRKPVSTYGPEARLYHAMFAALLFPVAMFIYAWCTFPSVTWVALTIGIALFMWATFIMFLTVFNYLAEWYTNSLAPSFVADVSTLATGLLPLQLWEDKPFV
ncbi:hypothetical protein EUX98_g4677 [Antrodiella citrinella]|uniref:Major facilitator superfamily (MFS) profile domain-containing protein n=1 Tax=Antrodiella citrinella TaxID=2447956 RepID=A0A4V3XIK1_9APHY|nr:hypothetical protein EUX98_g4677 [Antrodiella citrinella]